MAPRLKVFVTSDGLTDYVVAVSSKAKALAAWGSHQDLFKSGLAHEAREPALVDAALAQPGEVLRRPAGSRAALERIKPARRKAPAPKQPSERQLKRVAAAEARLAEADARYDEALAKLDQERAALDARHAAARAKLEQALKAAKQAPG
jgi:hypothetical protein